MWSRLPVFALLLPGNLREPEHLKNGFVSTTPKPPSEVRRTEQPVLREAPQELSEREESNALHVDRKKL